MNNIIAHCNRTYNPTGRNNALADIKRLLTSRDTGTQSKACGYLIEVISRYSKTSTERIRMVEYLLDNDITVFLCEATSNLDFSVFRSVLSCLRLLWHEQRYFSEEHASQSLTSVLRALAHYSNSGSYTAVDYCLHFLCDLLNGIKSHRSASPLSQQSAYSAEQLLACLILLAAKISNRCNTILSSALVLHALVSYQPVNLRIRSATASVLAEVFKEWFSLLLDALKHSSLMGNSDDDVSMLYAVTCQLGMDGLRLIQSMKESPKSCDFVQSILVDSEEINALRRTGAEIMKVINNIILELVTFTKDTQNQIPNAEYTLFLKFLFKFQTDSQRNNFPDLCDTLFSNGYLKMLPQVQIARQDTNVRQASTLVLGEMLKALSEKYLGFCDDNEVGGNSANDIHRGLLELQYGIEKPQTLGVQLKQCQPYSLLIYIYFYCQSEDDPQEATAPLLPYLIEHILKLQRGFQPPKYIIKSLWLVLAMSTISNGTLTSLDQRVYLERATDRFTTLLMPDPSIYYTHNPAILLWAFSSSRITYFVRKIVLSQWLKTEDYIPLDLANESTVLNLILDVVTEQNDKALSKNAMEAINLCIKEGDDLIREEFATTLWSMLPNMLSKVLIDCDFANGLHISSILELATSLIPQNIDDMVCLKIAVLLSTVFTKAIENAGEERYHFENVCLKLCLYLLGFSHNHNDGRVLMTYMNRPNFLTSVLACINSVDDRVACASLQLLSYIVHYFTKGNNMPTTILQVETTSVLKSLKQDSANERGGSLLQLVYTILNSGFNTPLAFSNSLVEVCDGSQEYKALRALMFRVQMLCCKGSTTQSSAGWKTLSTVFKHAIVTQNDTKLTAILTMQPWTHTLIRFQLTQEVTAEFLTFLNNWLMLLKITLKSRKSGKVQSLVKHGLIFKSLSLLRKYVVLNDELKDLKRKTLMIVKDIVEEMGLKKEFKV